MTTCGKYAHPEFAFAGNLVLSRKFSRAVSQRKAYFPVVLCLAKTESSEEGEKQIGSKRVVIVGGRGRIGKSTAVSLGKLFAESNGAGSSELELVIAGRDQKLGEAACTEIGGNISFSQCDIDDLTSISKTLDGADLVIHSAGPFQRKEHFNVLEAAIATRTAYIDVCDDLEFSQKARKLHSKAVAAGVPAITTTGIYPGVSNLMAAELVRLSQQEQIPSLPKSLRFSYYTAGSGGAGPTILATSFLLLGEPVLAYKDNLPLKLKPYSYSRKIDFGKGIGKKMVYLLNLPEVESCHSILSVPTVSARFGTDPPFWNWAMEAMVNLLPVSVLSDVNLIQQLVDLTNPMVRLVDNWAGERMAIRVDLDCQDERKAAAIYSHKSLSQCVGQSTAAFAMAVLEGSSKPGVWFPEEEGGIAVEDREKLLRRAAQGTIQFVLNKSPWMIEREPRNLGFGIYF